MSTSDFYDRLSPFYHLIFPNWEASIQRQAAQLEAIIRNTWGPGVQQILDLACGIGTQTLGLAQRGYQLTASDLSAAAVSRAQQEARTRNLKIDFSVSDMRHAYTHHQRSFDLVLLVDNVLPHLLTETDILQACREFYACTRRGGGVLLSMRDYDQIERKGTQIKPHGLRIEGTVRYLVFQVWEFSGYHYDLSMYLLRDEGGETAETHVMRTQYYAISPKRVQTLLKHAGFTNVQRLDDAFYQPVIIAHKQ